jgi:beta-lactamase superfamily II metal-dependent hydrolase
MDVSTLYVGQGALAVVRNSREAVIVDSLMPCSEDSQRRPIESQLTRLLRDHKLCGLVLTSFDADHCCVEGIDFIFSKFQPDWIMYPKYYKDTDCASAAFGVIEKHERKRAGTAHPLNRVAVRLDKVDSRTMTGLSKFFEYEVFSPHLEDMDCSNNSGIVLKLTGVGPTGFSYLITGDTETGRWERISALFGNALRSSVLAAPHHGSKTGAHAKSLLNIEPNTVLISAGVDNQYGHPDSQALAAFQRVARHVHSTNVEGGVSLFTKLNGLDFDTQLFR